MNRLEIKLKQHTPLIHFQHDQEGATLRASEVKPKLDRFVLTRLGQGNYQAGIAQAKTNGWLIGRGDHPALDYKMRIEASSFQNVMIPIKSVKKNGVLQTDEIGRQLYATNNYPDNDSSIIMSNIGGRAEDEVFNLVIANNIELTLISDNIFITDMLKGIVCDFFGRNSFGNRTSKGFGSFEVKSINGEKVEGDWYTDSYILSFSLLNDEMFNKSEVYKDVFRVVNKLWKQLKRLSGVRGKAERNALLDVRPQNIRGAERIPSPIRFKPIVDIYKDGRMYRCDINISIFYNKELINKVSDLQGVVHYKNLLASLKTNIEGNLSGFLSNTVNFDIDSTSLSFE